MKFAPIQLSATGTIVPAVANNKKIRVIAFSLSSSGIVNVQFQSHVTPTNLTGLRYMIANSVWDSPYAIEEKFAGMAGLFETLPGEALDLALSASVAVGGFVIWDERT